MPFADIRKRLATLLGSIDGIGTVHEFRRNTDTWEKLIRRHVKGGRLNSWEISRSNLSEGIDTFSGAVGNEDLYDDDHQVVIRGYMTVNDEKATEKVFQDLIDRIIEKLRKDNRLGGFLLVPVYERANINVTIDHAMFGNVFAHFAEITFIAVERVEG